MIQQRPGSGNASEMTAHCTQNLDRFLLHFKQLLELQKRLSIVTLSDHISHLEYYRIQNRFRNCIDIRFSDLIGAGIGTDFVDLTAERGHGTAVLGAGANIAKEYATKRYRSNCINWGMAPLLTKDETVFENGDWVFVPGIRKAILGKVNEFDAYVVKADGSVVKMPVATGDLTDDERQIIADGCLINYYRNN